MIASTQIANTEILALMAVLVFKILSRKVLFINRKGKLLFKKITNFLGYRKAINSWNAKFSGNF